MLITVKELETFSGVFIDEEDETKLSLRNIYIGAATEKINNFLGYDVEEHFDDLDKPVPNLIKKVCLEIATLIQLEENSNLGVNSSSDVGGVSRSFLNVVNFDKYLAQISFYKLGDALSL